MENKIKEFEEKLKEAEKGLPKYPQFKTGDRVIKFDYWNTRPEISGIVVAQSDHFVEIRKDGFWDRREWVSKERVELIK